MDNSKVYVNVSATFSKDGRLLPLSITWEDGREFIIDQVLEIRQAAAMKLAVRGIVILSVSKAGINISFSSVMPVLGEITSGDGS